MSKSDHLRNMRSALRYFLALLLCMALLPSMSFSFELLIGTEERDSFSHYAGKIICRSINKFDQDVTCRAVPSDNYTDNLTNVQGGSLDLALVNTKIISDAFHGDGLFKYVSLDYDQLRLLLPLYRTPISLLVRRDAHINTLGDLIGKKVNAGRGLSLQEIVFEAIMAAKGWQENTFSLYQNLPETNSQDYIALHTGSVQAMLHIGMHPDDKLKRSMANGQTKIVGISDQAAKQLVEGDSGFYPRPISSGTYSEYVNDIDTLSLETLLVTSSDTDSETVALVLEAILAAKKQLQNSHPSFLAEAVNIETLNQSYLHPHPEAILFFQSNQNRF
jgi:TRAP transporter TAXI family solute receptor